jgi:hypothetical protein
MKTIERRAPSAVKQARKARVRRAYEGVVASYIRAISTPPGAASR